MTDSEFLTWIADRLVHVHGDPDTVDFVLKLRRMAQVSERPTEPPLKAVRDLLSFIYIFGLDNSSGRLTELLNAASKEVELFPVGGAESPEADK